MTFHLSFSNESKPNIPVSLHGSHGSHLPGAAACLHTSSWWSQCVLLPVLCFGWNVVSPLWALTFDSAVLVNAIPDNIPVGEVWVVTAHFSGYKTETLRDEMSPPGTQQNSREAGKYYLLSNYLPDLFILIGN